jgi:Flp pilus assembly protein TadD
LLDGQVSPDGRRESCTAVIQSAAQTRQELVAAYYNRGLAYGRNGNYDRAIADLDDAIRLNPKNAPCLQQSRVGLQQQGQL